MIHDLFYRMKVFVLIVVCQIALVFFFFSSQLNVTIIYCIFMSDDWRQEEVMFWLRLILLNPPSDCLRRM